MDSVISVLEMIGLFAFAVTGSLEAIKSKNDLLGVLILGVTTSVGGGIIRDLILGINPPNAFANPRYIYIATLVSFFVFILFYYNKKILGNPSPKYFDEILTFSDAIGLAVFTVLGMNVAFSLSTDFRGVIYVFVGLISGVGGGILRDVMLNKVPYILDRNIYASASILCAVAYYLFMKYDVFYPTMSMVFSMIIIFTTRMYAAKNNLHLPKVDWYESW